MSMNGSQNSSDLSAKVEKKRKGFASMSPEKRREIASKGGKAAHEKGTAYEWDSNSGKRAGQKGGASAQGKRLAKKEAEEEGRG